MQALNLDVVGGLTMNDWSLIERAKELHYDDFDLVGVMEEEADTREAKELLHSIKTTMYHKHENSCDLM